jgi:hypothetical protein
MHLLKSVFGIQRARQAYPMLIKNRFPLFDFAGSRADWPQVLWCVDKAVQSTAKKFFIFAVETEFI